jgi:uncharacterized DUF497 family protein
MMQFQWDREKCKKNIETHGIDFVDAAEIFSSPMLIIPDDRKSYGESRYIGMGEIQGRIMVIVYTDRSGDVIRIISLRKADKREQSKFKKEIKNRLGPD